MIIKGKNRRTKLKKDLKMPLNEWSVADFFFFPSVSTECGTIIIIIANVRSDINAETYWLCFKGLLVSTEEFQVFEKRNCL